MVGAHERRLASGKEAKQQAKKKAHLAIVRQRRIERSIERKVNTACKKLKELAPSMSDEEIKPYADAIGKSYGRRACLLVRVLTPKIRSQPKSRRNAN
jgi:hypothetical protein